MFGPGFLAVTVPEPSPDSLISFEDYLFLLIEQYIVVIAWTGVAVTGLVVALVLRSILRRHHRNKAWRQAHGIEDLRNR